MVRIDINSIPHSFDGKVILISERDVKFATQYEVWNSKTDGSEVFDFSHSTGAEFDPKTQWIYKSASSSGLELHVANDHEMTKKAAQNYLNAKLRK